MYTGITYKRVGDTVRVQGIKDSRVQVKYLGRGMNSPVFLPGRAWGGEAALSGLKRPGTGMSILQPKCWRRKR